MAMLTRISRRVLRPARSRLARRRGYRFGRDIAFTATAGERGASAPNRLEEYFDGHTDGPGIWKWRHYFEVYDRHCARFVGADVNVLEIGVYSGGSLEMWRDYFGPRCRVHGVDIAAACKAYESENVRISIGDQADPKFWAELLAQGEAIDIAIDDGGHLPHQQIATLEALLPRINPGGVYLCEDIHGPGNEFHDYVAGLARNLHTWNLPDPSVARAVPSELQRMVHSVHLYPFLVVIERSTHPLEELVAPRHGTEWQPFLGTRPEDAHPAATA